MRRASTTALPRWSVAASSGALKGRTYSDWDTVDPAFSTGGDYLAYHGRSDGLDLVYTLSLSDYRPDGPAFSVGQGRHPSWSPDGSSLVYAQSSKKLICLE